MCVTKQCTKTRVQAHALHPNPKCGQERCILVSKNIFGIEFGVQMKKMIFWALLINGRDLEEHDSLALSNLAPTLLIKLPLIRASLNNEFLHFLLRLEITKVIGNKKERRSIMHASNHLMEPKSIQHTKQVLNISKMHGFL
ncbi:hypothetical protein ACJX0J_040075 [Zea mays]